MSTYLGKNYSFGLLYVSFVNVYQYVYVAFPFGFEGRMWDFIVLISDHCLTFDNLNRLHKTDRDF